MIPIKRNAEYYFVIRVLRCPVTSKSALNLDKRLVSLGGNEVRLSGNTYYKVDLNIARHIAKKNCTKYQSTLRLTEKWSHLLVVRC